MRCPQGNRDAAGLASGSALTAGVSLHRCNLVTLPITAWEGDKDCLTNLNSRTTGKISIVAFVAVLVLREAGAFNDLISFRILGFS